MKNHQTQKQEHATCQLLISIEVDAKSLFIATFQRFSLDFQLPSRVLACESIPVSATGLA